MEHGVDALVVREVQVPRLEVLGDVREMHVGAAAEVAVRDEREPERLEVRDVLGAEVGDERRGEAHEELGGLGNQVGAADPGRDRHLLRQADTAVEAAAGEALADARHPEQSGAVEEGALGVGDVVELVAAQEHRDVVLLEDRVCRIAGEADRVEEGGLLGAPVARQVRLRGRGDVAAEVRQAPGDEDAEPGRGSGIAPVEVRQRLLELGLRCGKVLGLDRGGDDLVVERGHDHLGSVVAHDLLAAEQVLLRAERHRGRAVGRARELVDGLVDAGSAEHPGGRSADHDLFAGELHAVGLIRTRWFSSSFRYATTFVVVERRRDVLADRVEPARVVPGEQQVPLVGVLVHRVHRRRDPGRPHGPGRVGEARDVHGVVLAVHRVDLAADRDLRAARIAAQVDVELAAGRPASGLLPHERLEVAAIGADGIDVVPAVADRADQRIGQPGRAVDRRLDLVRRASASSPCSGRAASSGAPRTKRRRRRARGRGPEQGEPAASRPSRVQPIDAQPRANQPVSRRDLVDEAPASERLQEARLARVVRARQRARGPRPRR